MRQPLMQRVLLMAAMTISLSAMAQAGKEAGTGELSAASADKSVAENKPAGDKTAGEAAPGGADSGEPKPGASEAAPSDPAKNPDQSTYAVRLRDLEDRVNRLKEQIFRSKARLSLLAETVLERKIAGARAKIVFRNEMGGSFRLQKATFLLDGGPILNSTDEAGSLAEKETIDLFDGPVVPGDHTLNVVLNYQGNGYGIFSYLKGYTFKTRSSHTFTITEGKQLILNIIGFEKGGATTPLEERPAIRYTEAVSDYVASGPDAVGSGGNPKK